MADCTPSKPDGTEGTATCEMTCKEGKKKITKKIYGCIVKNDGDLQERIKRHLKQLADMEKLRDTKFCFYSCDPDFKQQIYTRIKVTFHRFTKPAKPHSHVLSSPPPGNIVKVDKNIFVLCDFQDFNESKFLRKYSKEVLAGQDLNLNKSTDIDIYGLSYDHEEEDGLRFIPLKLSHQSSNVYGVDAKHFKKLENSGPVLGQDKKTVIGGFGKKEENKIYISIFGNNQGDPASHLPPTSPSERDQASALPPPGPSEGDCASVLPPAGPSERDQAPYLQLTVPSERHTAHDLPPPASSKRHPVPDLPPPASSKRHPVPDLPPPAASKRHPVPDLPPPGPSRGNQQLANQRKLFHTLNKSVTTNTMAQNHKGFEDDIKKNREKVTSLKEEISSLKQEIKNKDERIASVEEELRKCRGNENSLEDKVKSLEKEIQDLRNKIQDLRNKNEELVKQLKDMENHNKSLEARIEKLEKEKKHEENVVIIAEICPALQRNMCKYVLGEYFDDAFFYKFKEIDKHIDAIPEQGAKKLATEQLNKVKIITSWKQNERLVYCFKAIKEERIGIAHPKLSSEKIQQATNYLKEKTDLLDEKKVKYINILKELWEKTEDLLQPHPQESQDLGSPRDVSSTCTVQKQTEQTQDTYASKAASGRGDPYTSGKANARGPPMSSSRPQRNVTVVR